MTFTILPLLLALQGCIVFDGHCSGCDPWGDDGRPDRDRPPREDPVDTGEAEDTGSPVEPEPPSYALALLPSEAEQGETFIASLGSSGEDVLDLALIETLRFLGDVEILASDLRSAELLLTVAVAPEAAVGPVDLLAELDDGTALWQEAALTVWEAGSGHQAGGSGGDEDPCE